MKRKILITGRKVHDVGYRVLLLGIAESLGILNFYADNTVVDDKQAVKILIDDDDNKVNEFIKIIKETKPEKARVDEIKIESYEGNVMKIENYYRYFSAMQLVKIANVGTDLLKEQKEAVKEIKNIGSKIDEISLKVSELRYDLKMYLDKRFEKIEQEIEKIKQKVGIV